MICSKSQSVFALQGVWAAQRGGVQGQKKEVPIWFFIGFLVDIHRLSYEMIVDRLQIELCEQMGLLPQANCLG